MKTIKLLNLMLAFVVSVGMNSCSKKTETPPANNNNNGNNNPTKPTLTLQHFIVNDTLSAEVGSFWASGTGGDWDMTAGHNDGTNAISFLCYFNPKPDKTRTLTVDYALPNNDLTKTQFLMKFTRGSDIQDYLAHSGTAELTVMPAGNDSLYLKFTDITFYQTGKPNKVISGWIGFH